MVFKGLVSLVLAQCGLIKVPDPDSERRCMDMSEMRYSQKFKSDKAHAEADIEMKQMDKIVEKSEKTRSKIKVTAAIRNPEPERVKRYEEEKDARENSVCQRTYRHLRSACIIGRYVHGSVFEGSAV